MYSVRMDISVPRERKDDMVVVVVVGGERENAIVGGRWWALTIIEVGVDTH